MFLNLNPILIDFPLALSLKYVFKVFFRGGFSLDTYIIKNLSLALDILIKRKV